MIVAASAGDEVRSVLIAASVLIDTERMLENMEDPISHGRPQN